MTQMTQSGSITSKASSSTVKLCSYFLCPEIGTRDYERKTDVWVKWRGSWQVDVYTEGRAGEAAADGSKNQSALGFLSWSVKYPLHVQPVGLVGPWLVQTDLDYS